jgi:hypothetical protein
MSDKSHLRVAFVVFWRQRGECVSRLGAACRVRRKTPKMGAQMQQTPVLTRLQPTVPAM